MITDPVVVESLTQAWLAAGLCAGAALIILAACIIATGMYVSELETNKTISLQLASEKLERERSEQQCSWAKRGLLSQLNSSNRERERLRAELVRVLNEKHGA